MMGWDSTRRARRAMGSALRPRWGLIHYRARSNPTVSIKPKQTHRAPQRVEREPGGIRPAVRGGPWARLSGTAGA